MLVVAGLSSAGCGSSGESCTVVDNGDGTKTITCGDDQVTVSDGVDGQSCTVTDNGDGTKTIACEDGTEVTVSDGVSCSMTDNGDGTVTFACDDGTQAVRPFSLPPRVGDRAEQRRPAL